MAINKDDMKNKFANAWCKTVDFSKKAAKDISDKTKDEMYAYRLKKYNPLYEDEFESDDFKYPSVIRIAQDSENNDVDVCDGAIGWRNYFEDVEILHIYSRFVERTGLEFVPVVKTNDTFCVDPFNTNRYISYNDVFINATDEKLAELEHIAYCLGAKSCSVEIIEINGADNSQASGASIGYSGLGIGANKSSRTLTGNQSGGKTVTNFSGHSDPYRPDLKWFAHNDSVNKLIDMRCKNPQSVQKKQLELKGSTMLSMSKNMAVAIDKIVKIAGSISMEKQSAKEHNSVLIFEVEF